MIQLKLALGFVMWGMCNLSHAASQRVIANDSGSSFEVASIKPNKSGREIVTLDIQPGGRFVATEVTLNLLVQVAYAVKDFQISQAPPWFDTEKFDIDARPEESVRSSFKDLPADEASTQVMKMLRSLLTERCKLVLSYATKELPGYTLVIAKSGPKLHPSAFKPPDRLEPREPVGPDGAPPKGGLWLQGRGHLISTGTDIPSFADMLSRFTGRTVLDKTGLSGLYDFTLQWTPGEGEGSVLPRSYADVDPTTTPSEASGPTLFSALQEQLGLKLESEKVPTKILVIQHVERPSEN